MVPKKMLIVFIDHTDEWEYEVIEFLKWINLIGFVPPSVHFKFLSALRQMGNMGYNEIHSHNHQLVCITTTLSSSFYVVKSVH